MKRTLSTILAILTLLSLLTVTAPYAAAEERSASAIDRAVTIDETTDDEQLNGDEITIPQGYDLESQSNDGTEENSVPLLRKNTDLAETGAGITYNVSGTTLTISGSGSMAGLKGNDRSYPWTNHASTIKKVTVNKGITDISDFAFMNFSQLTSISLPDGITKIGEAAFYGCGSLSTISLPSSVKSIERGAFYLCRSLGGINLNSVEAIKDYAFQGTAIKTVALGKSLTTLNGLSFFGVEVTSFSVDNANQKYCSDAGILYSKSKDTIVLYPCEKTGNSFTVPTSVKTIESCAFARNKYLQSVNLGSVTSIGESAFQEASSLKSIVIPDSVTQAGYFAFYHCPNLKSVTFGKGLKETSYQMFEQCTSLTDINFGGLTDIDARTFADCSALETVTLPSTVTSIGNASFGDCYKLVSFTAPSVTEIPYQAFLNDRSLTSISFPKLENIYRIAFYGCSSLKSVHLPESTQFVHSNAFHENVEVTCANTKLSRYGQNGLREIESVRVTGTLNYQEAFDVLNLVNKERAKEGLNPLVMNASLLDTAMRRAVDNIVLFSHTRPDGSSCFTANNLMAAENIAIGQHNAAEAMNSWMNSEGHRKNILTGNYTTIGIGCFESNGVTTWVQCFGTGADSKNCDKPANTKRSRRISMAVGTFEEETSGTGIIWGAPKSFSYDFDVYTNDRNINKNETTHAVMRVRNPEFPSCFAVLDNVGITWSSSDSAVATVDSQGTVTGVGNGYVSINADLFFYSATSQRIQVKGAATVPTPVIKSLNNVEDGIKISWDKVDGAAQYRVYYKGRNGWTKLTDTSSNSVIDYDVVSGNNYTYTIRALDQNGNHISDYDHNGSKIRFIKAPQFSLSNAANGVRISWGKVTGAEKYRVFYYGSKGWTRLADTAATSFLDTDVSSNHRYVYTVRCISADGNTYISDYRVGKGINYFAAPSLTLKNVEDGVKISWNKIDGAAKYRVYYKGRNGWTKLTDTTSTSVIDYDVVSGTNYTYTIRALDQNGNHISDYYHDGFKIKFLRAPSFTLSSEKGGVRIKWNKVGGTEKYRVFYYGSKGWTRLADTANTSFLDTDVSSGHRYVYTVRCISSDGKTYTSDYRVGKGINYR